MKGRLTRRTARPDQVRRSAVRAFASADLHLEWAGSIKPRRMMPVAPDAGLPLYATLPFALMLLAIALFPLWLPHWWEHNPNKLLVAGLLGLPVLGLYLRRAPGARRR